MTVIAADPGDPVTLPTVILRPFGRADFGNLISWASTPEAIVQWCGSFFRYPLDEEQLERYLHSSSPQNTRVIFTALDRSGDAVGHVEISMIWPHLSSRLSRVLVSPLQRRKGIGSAIVGCATRFSFDAHHVARIDLGVDARNAVAIGCYRGQGFDHIGTWPQAMSVAGHDIDVAWMTLTRPV